MIIRKNVLHFFHRPVLKVSWVGTHIFHTSTSEASFSVRFYSTNKIVILDLLILNAYAKQMLWLKIRPELNPYYLFVSWVLEQLLGIPTISILQRCFQERLIHGSTTAMYVQYCTRYTLLLQGPQKVTRRKISPTSISHVLNLETRTVEEPRDDLNNDVSFLVKHRKRKVHHCFLCCCLIPLDPSRPSHPSSIIHQQEHNIEDED